MIRTPSGTDARLIALAALLLLAAGTALADPPGRVARLANLEGTVSFSPAGESEWVRAVQNRPLVTGDRLWSDADSRVELQTPNATVRLGAATSVVVANLDDSIQQFQLTQGTLQLRVRSLVAGDQVEIDTPNFAFVARRPGTYRFDVDADGGATALVVRDGEGDVYGDATTYRIGNGQAARFAGTDLQDAQYRAPAPFDSFDRWAQGREQRYASLPAARYVAADVVGYEDLDQYGTWRAVPDYGNVWVPRGVAASWAPYRDGHWAWIDPWGWTWVDDAPWGFAPFHYGRWAQIDNAWCWVPGPVRQRAVYAPALVAFVGGAGFALSVGGGSAIGWFPLGPGEVYRPAYTASRDYFTRVNVTNTVVNTTYVTNIYNNRDRATDVRYVNMNRPAAITAVPPAAFAQSQPVQRAAIPMNAQVINKAEVMPLAKIAPQRESVTGAAPAGRAAPARAMEKPVVAKAPPPPPPVSLDSKLPALRAAPGKPVDRPAGNAARATPPPGQATPAVAGGPPVRVVNNAPPPKPLPQQAQGNAPATPPGGNANANGKGGGRDGAGPPNARGTERIPAPPPVAAPANPEPVPGNAGGNAPRGRNAEAPAPAPAAQPPSRAAPGNSGNAPRGDNAPPQEGNARGPQPRAVPEPSTRPVPETAQPRSRPASPPTPAAIAPPPVAPPPSAPAAVPPGAQDTGRPPPGERGKGQGARDERSGAPSQPAARPTEPRGNSGEPQRAPVVVAPTPPARAPAAAPPPPPQPPPQPPPPQSGSAAAPPQQQRVPTPPPPPPAAARPAPSPQNAAPPPPSEGKGKSEENRGKGKNKEPDEDKKP